MVIEKAHNTKFSHAIASMRRKKNQVHRIKVNELMTSKPRVIKSNIVSHFKSLYKEPQLPVITMPKGVLKVLRPEVDESLESFPTNEEINRTVWSCNGSKGLGFDG